MNICCPSCGRENERHQSIESDALVPGDGDWAICWACASPAVYVVSDLGVLHLRLPTDAEILEIQSDPTIAVALESMRRSDTPSEAVALAREGLG